MKKLLTRAEMDHIKRTDFEGYKKEISKDWETQAQDIAKVKSIIASFDAHEADQNFSLGGRTFPIWAVDAYQYFDAKYGSQFGSVIFEKVLSKIWGEIPHEISTL